MRRRQAWTATVGLLVVMTLAGCATDGGRPVPEAPSTLPEPLRQALGALDRALDYVGLGSARGPTSPETPGSGDGVPAAARPSGGPPGTGEKTASGRAPSGPSGESDRSALPEQLARLDRAIARDPTDSVAWTDRGAALRQLGRHREALASFERALELDPRNTVARMGRELALARLGDRVDARRGAAATRSGRDGSEAKASQTRSPGAVSPGEGPATGGQKRLAGSAVPATQEARKDEDGAKPARLAKPDPLAEIRAARVRGDLDAALTVADRALAKDPDDLDLLVARAEVLVALGRRPEALADIERAIDVAPGRADLHYRRGILLRQLGRTEEAQIAIERANALAAGGSPPSASSRVEALLAKARREVEAGNLELALSYGNHAIELDPESAEAWAVRGAVLRRLGHSREALESLDRALRLDPKLAAAWTERGGVQLALDRPREALMSFYRALELDPRDAEAWAARGAVLRQLGRNREALASFERALELDPQNALAKQGRALAAAALGGAAGEGGASAKQGPGPEVRDLVADLRDEGGRRVLVVAGAIGNGSRVDRPVPALRVAMLDGSGQPLARHRIGAPKPRLAPEESVRFEARIADPPPGTQAIVLTLGDEEIARASVRRVAIAESRPEQTERTGRGSGSAPAPPPRVAALTPAPQQPSGRIEAKPPAKAAPSAVPRAGAADGGAAVPAEAIELVANGDRARRAGRNPEALALYDRAIALAPEHVDAWFGRAETLRALGRFAEALEAYERVLSLDPDRSLAWSGLGFVYAELGRTEEAREAFARALATGLGDRRAEGR